MRRPNAILIGEMHRRLVFLLSLALERSKNAKISSRSSEIVRYVGQSRYSPKKKKKEKKKRIPAGESSDTTGAGVYVEKYKKEGKSTGEREKCSASRALNLLQEDPTVRDRRYPVYDILAHPRGDLR